LHNSLVDKLTWVKPTMKEISKAVIEKDAKFLLLKRSPNSKTYPNSWDFVGGKLDLGETPKEAVIRETKEEISYDIAFGEEIREERYTSKERDLLFHYFIPQSFSGKIKLSKDHSMEGWFDKEEIKELELHPSVKLFFKF